MTDLKPILSSFKREIKEILGKNFQDLILFGSYARGEESTESDIDLLVVLKKEEKRKTEYWQILGNTIIEYDLKYNKLFSIKFTSTENFKNSDTPFLSEIRRNYLKI